VLGFYPTSGPDAVAGTEELAGLKAAATVINAKGGILGHKVEIKVDNDQNVGTIAVAQGEQALASGVKYNLIVPGINGTDAIPLAALFAHTQVLQVTPAAESPLNDPSKYPNLFMTLNDFPANEQAIANALKSKGITKAAFISGDDSSGQGAQAAFAAAAKSAGITVTASVLVPDTAVDAKPQLQQALASNPQVLVTGAYTLALPTLLAARAALGSTVPYYLDSFAGSFPLEAVFKQSSQLAGITVEQFPYLVKGAPAQRSAWFKTFIGAFGKLQPHPVINVIAGVVSYNALMVARAAAVKAGSISGPAMVKALDHIATASQVPDFVGGPSTGIFSPTNHQLAVKPANYGFYRAGSTLDGVLVPGT
jgi:ABC-type branched-subunit amino acid transport system substrate-binding protein